MLLLFSVIRMTAPSQSIDGLETAVVNASTLRAKLPFKMEQREFDHGSRWQRLFLFVYMCLSGVRESERDEFKLSCVCLLLFLSVYVFLSHDALLYRRFC